jgi:hypothetical protein
MFPWLVFAAFVTLLLERLGIPPRVSTAVLGVLCLLMLLALFGVFGARSG